MSVPGASSEGRSGIGVGFLGYQVLGSLFITHEGAVFWGLFLDCLDSGSSTFLGRRLGGCGHETVGLSTLLWNVFLLVDLVTVDVFLFVGFLGEVCFMCALGASDVTGVVKVSGEILDQCIGTLF